MSIISPEPASKGTTKTDAAATTESAEVDSGFMAVLAEALAAWTGHAGGEEDAHSDAAPTEMLDGDDEPAATLTLLTEGFGLVDPASHLIDGESDDAAVDAPVEPALELAVAETEGQPVTGTSSSAVADGEQVLDGPELVEDDAPVGTATPTGDEPIDVDVPDVDVPAADLPTGDRVDSDRVDSDRADESRLADRPSAPMGQHEGSESVPADAPGIRGGSPATEVDTAGRSASRLVSDAPVSPAPVADAEGPAPSRAPTSTAEAMFDAELAAQEADEDPWLQVARVVRPLRQLADGTHRIALQLRPAELGTVHLEVALEDGRLSMRAVTETVVARDAFAGSLPELRAELSRSGIDLGTLDVGEQTMDGEGDPTTGRPTTGGGDASPGRRPATDSPSPDGAAHPPPSGSTSGVGAGRLDLAL